MGRSRYESELRKERSVIMEDGSNKYSLSFDSNRARLECWPSILALREVITFA